MQWKSLLTSKTSYGNLLLFVFLREYLFQPVVYSFCTFRYLLLVYALYFASSVFLHKAGLSFEQLTNGNVISLQVSHSLTPAFLKPFHSQLSFSILGMEHPFFIRMPLPPHVWLLTSSVSDRWDPTSSGLQAAGPHKEPEPDRAALGSTYSQPWQLGPIHPLWEVGGGVWIEM